MGCQIVVLMQTGGHFAEVIQPQPQAQGAEDYRPQDCRVQRPVQPLPPGIVKLNIGLDFGGNLKGGRQAGLQRPFPQQRHRKAVQRLNGGGVHFPQRPPAAFPFRVRPRRLAGVCAAGFGVIRRGWRRVLRRLLQLLAHPFPQFGGGGLGESDGRQPAHFGLPAGQQRHDARHQHRSFAGTGPGLHEQRLLQPPGDAVAGRVVNRVRGGGCGGSRHN